MKNKALIVATVALSLTSALNAAKVYEGDNGMLDISGRVKGYLSTGKRTDSIGYNDGSSRVTISGETNVKYGLVAFGTTEWGYDVSASGSEEFLNHRLSFAGLKGDFGSVAIGRQWSAYSNVASYTDGFEYTGGDANLMYTDGDSGGISGLGRANDAIQYQGEFGNVKLAVIGQAEREDSVLRTRKYGFGAALEYKTDAFSVGLASHATDNEFSFLAEKSTFTTSTVVGAKGMLLDKAVYLSATASYHTDIADTYLDFADSALGVEAMAAFFYDTELQSGFYLGYNYNQADYDGTSGTAFNYLEIGGRHSFAKDIYVFYAYKLDLRSEEDTFMYDSTTDSDSSFAVGARYSF